MPAPRPRLVEEEVIHIGGAWTVDLVANKDGERIAVEMETGKSDMAANARKSERAAFQKLISVHTRG